MVTAAGGTPKLVVADLPLLNDYHGRNYAWHPTDDLLAYMKGGQLWLVRVEPGGPGTPRRLGESLGALAPTVHWFTRDGKALVVGTEPIDDKGYADPRPRGLAVIPRRRRTDTHCDRLGVGHRRHRARRTAHGLAAGWRIDHRARD